MRDGERDSGELQVQLKRHDDFARTALVTLAHLDYAHGEQVFLRFVHAPFVLEGERLVDAAVRDVQVVDVGGVPVFGDGEDVDVVQHRAHHLAAGAVRLDKLVLLLHPLRVLKTQFGGERLHLVHERGGYLPGVSLENLLHLRDVRHVFLV